jgi:hypothetical protein
MSDSLEAETSIPLAPRNYDIRKAIKVLLLSFQYPIQHLTDWMRSAISIVGGEEEMSSKTPYMIIYLRKEFRDLKIEGEAEAKRRGFPSFGAYLAALLKHDLLASR